MNNSAVQNQDFDATINDIIQQHNEQPLANSADNGLSSGGSSIPDNSSTPPILIGEFVSALELKPEVIIDDDYDDDVIFTPEVEYRVPVTNGNGSNSPPSTSNNAETLTVNAATGAVTVVDEDDDDLIFTPEIKRAKVERQNEGESSKLQALLGKGNTNSSRKEAIKRPDTDMSKLLRFVCGQCGLDFELETKLEEHLVNGHVELCIMQNLKMVIFSKSCAHCTICGMELRYSTIRDLQFHYLRHMRYQPYKCKCHNYYFNDRYTAMLHLKNRQNENFNSKPMPPKPLPAKKSISLKPVHTLLQQPPTSQQQHQQHNEMYRPIKQSHSPPIPTMLFMSPSNSQAPLPLKSLSSMGSAMGPITPLEQELHDMCVKVEMKKAALKPSMADLPSMFDASYTESSVGYRCSECGIDFPNERAWKEHGNEEHDLKTIEGLNMTRHPDTGQLCCNQCGILLNGKWDNYKLRRHRLTHSPFKSFYCRICSYERKRKDDIVVHIRQAHA